MKPTTKNIIAVITGFVVGSAVNLGIVMIGPSIIPPPAGVDVMDPDSLAASMHLFEGKHFVAPFLAHALGTFVGATITFLIAATRKFQMAMIIGVLFLLGGMQAAWMLPAPIWFEALDIVLAYLPMAWLATVVGARLSKPSE